MHSAEGERQLCHSHCTPLTYTSAIILSTVLTHSHSSHIANSTVHSGAHLSLFAPLPRVTVTALLPRFASPLREPNASGNSSSHSPPLSSAFVMRTCVWRRSLLACALWMLICCCCCSLAGVLAHGSGAEVQDQVFSEAFCIIDDLDANGVEITLNGRSATTYSGQLQATEQLQLSVGLIVARSVQADIRATYSLSDGQEGTLVSTAGANVPGPVLATTIRFEGVVSGTQPGQTLSIRLTGAGCEGHEITLAVTPPLEGAVNVGVTPVPEAGGNENGNGNGNGNDGNNNGNSNGSNANSGRGGTSRCSVSELQLDGRVLTPVSSRAHTYFFSADSFGNSFNLSLLLQAEAVPAVNSQTQVSYKINRQGAFGMMTPGVNTASLSAQASVLLAYQATQISLLDRDERKTPNANVLLRVFGGGCRPSTIVLHLRNRPANQPASSGFCALSDLQVGLVSIDGNEVPDNVLALSPNFTASAYAYTYSNADLAGQLTFAVRAKALAGTSVVVSLGDTYSAALASEPNGQSGRVTLTGQFTVELAAGECFDLSVLVSSAMCTTAEYSLSCSDASSAAPAMSGFEDEVAGPVLTEEVANCALSSLTLGEGASFTPAFSWSQHQYACECDSLTFRSSVTATAADRLHNLTLSLSIDGGASVPLLSGVESPSWLLHNGVNTLAVTVSGACSETYTVSCTRYAQDMLEGQIITLSGWAYGSFGVCSGECLPGQATGTAAGTFTRRVDCRDENDAVVADSQCTTTKPESTRACLTPCGVRSLGRAGATGDEVSAAHALTIHAPLLVVMLLAAAVASWRL